MDSNIFPPVVGISLGRQDSLILFWHVVEEKGNLELKGGYPCGVIVKAMDCGIVIRDSVLQSRYYVHIRANTLGKCMNPLILPAMG